MKLHGNLDLQGNELRQAVLPTEVNFPTDGKAGESSTSPYLGYKGSNGKIIVSY